MTYFLEIDLMHFMRSGTTLLVMSPILKQLFDNTEFGVYLSGNQSCVSVDQTRGRHFADQDWSLGSRESADLTMPV